MAADRRYQPKASRKRLSLSAGKHGGSPIPRRAKVSVQSARRAKCARPTSRRKRRAEEGRRERRVGNGERAENTWESNGKFRVNEGKSSKSERAARQEHRKRRTKKKKKKSSSFTAWKTKHCLSATEIIILFEY
ncbi:uncharacterized protein LOC143218850 [Lasioglossum baleicum]|uniref:uncharacterized protein LOC143218850 n=1 Tax=Lasioglossum baleicum TaxID=434251 RepID=UPI003FCC8847